MFIKRFICISLIQTENFVNSITHCCHIKLFLDKIQIERETCNQNLFIHLKLIELSMLFMISINKRFHQNTHLKRLRQKCRAYYIKDEGKNHR